jgi:hydroxyacylglutathione hydrolase
MSVGWLCGVVLAACAPGFEHVGPLAPALDTTPGAPPGVAPGVTPGVTIDRIELQWSNVYLIRAAGAAVLVDSGSPSDRDALADALAARGVAPAQIKAVVVTHAHADHAGGARWLQAQGAAIFLGAADVGVAARGTNDPLHATNLLGALLAPVFMFPFTPFTPDVAVDHELDLADRGFPALHVVPVPGHTAGSLAVVIGSEACTGDLVKGNLVIGAHTPSEHLYQTDRLADHAALAALLARGLTRLYPGHRGPLEAGEVRAWLAGAADDTGANAVSIEGDVRGEAVRHGETMRNGDAGATAGLRVRGMLGRAVGYAFGVDARAGYLNGAQSELDAYPIGVALRSQAGGFVALTAGAGLGGVRSTTASHAVVELSGEQPLGAVRVIARASLGWTLGGPGYASDASLADEASALVGVRLGRDHTWGDYRAGHGLFVAVGYRNLGGGELIGLTLGAGAFAAR